MLRVDLREDGPRLFEVIGTQGVLDLNYLGPPQPVKGDAEGHRIRRVVSAGGDELYPD